MKAKELSPTQTQIEAMKARPEIRAAVVIALDAIPRTASQLARRAKAPVSEVRIALAELSREGRARIGTTAPGFQLETVYSGAELPPPPAETVVTVRLDLADARTVAAALFERSESWAKRGNTWASERDRELAHRFLAAKPS